MYDGLPFELDERKYQLGKTLGSGSYGVVVKAFDRINNRHVAVKQIPQLYDEPDVTKKIMREIVVMQSLRPCEYVLGLFDVELIGSNLYMIMSICEVDLFVVTQSETWLARMTNERYLSIMYQTLNALCFMHSVGVIHRDIKPANILIDKDFAVRVCDFGLARYVQNSDVLVDPSQPDMTEYVVSRWYRAPEIVLVPGRYGKAQDVWATACTFVEFYKRTILFPGATIVNQLHVIVDVMGRPTPEDLDFEMSERSKRYMSNIESANTGIDNAISGADIIHPDLANFIKQMLTFNPKRRPSSADCMRNPIFDSVRGPADYLYMQSVIENIHINHNAIDACEPSMEAVQPMMKNVVKDVRQELRKVEATMKKTKSQAEVALKALADQPPPEENSGSSAPPSVKADPLNGRGLDSLLPKLKPHTVQRVIQRRRSSERVDQPGRSGGGGGGGHGHEVIAPKRRQPQAMKRMGSIETLAKAEALGAAEAAVAAVNGNGPQPPSRAASQRSSNRPGGGAGRLIKSTMSAEKTSTPPALSNNNNDDDVHASTPRSARSAALSDSSPLGSPLAPDRRGNKVAKVPSYAQETTNSKSQNARKSSRAAQDHAK